MKRVLLVIGLVILMSPVADAQGLKFGVGAFAGGNIPLAQDDQKAGTAYGVLGRIRVFSFVVAEPNVVFGKWGKPDPIKGIDLGIDGSKINSYGVNALIGGVPGTTGFKPYGVLGAAIYKVKNDDTGYDESKLGYSIGLGMSFGVIPQLSVDLRGMGVIAPQEQGSKKAVLVTGGLTYYFTIGY